MGSGWRIAVSIVGRYRGILNRRRDGRWSPIELGQALNIWLDANDENTITLNANRVVEWRDKSTNARVVSQPIDNRRPTLALNSQNDQPGVSFNGFSQSLRSTGNWPLTGNPNFSAFVIYRKRTLTQGSVYGWGSTAVSLGSMILFDNNDLTGYAYAGDNNYRISPVPTNTTTIQGYVKESGPIETTSTATTDGGETETGGHSNQVPDIQSSPFWLGGFNNLSEFYLNGIVYEVILTDTVLPEILQRTVEGYLAHRWGTEEQLPPDHPFRLAPP